MLPEYLSYYMNKTMIRNIILLSFIIQLNGCFVIREKVKIYYRHTPPPELNLSEAKHPEENMINTPDDDESPTPHEEELAPEMLICGYIETVTIGVKELAFAAKLDTGADTCSLGVEKIQLFERDGKKWVRFNILSDTDNQSIPFEKPVIRRVRIKRHNMKSQRRVVVKLPVTLAGQTLEREFSLTKRGKFSTAVLLGRNFLNGAVLVDAARTYVVSKEIIAENNE